MSPPREHRTDRLHIRLEGGLWRIQPLTRLDLTSSDEFLKDTLRMLSQEPTDAICDLSLVPYMSSSGVKALLNIQRFLKAHRFQLVLFNLTPEVQKLVELSELVNVFTIVKDCDAALKQLAV